MFNSASAHRFHPIKTLGTTLAVAGMLGCAALPDAYRDPRDPWEAYNRAMYQFNTDFDTVLWKPVAESYRYITPEFLDRGITNFFNNLRDFTSVFNNLFQLKVSRAGTDLGRIVVNSTVGLLGFIDVASNLDLPSYKEDFGQTLGYWGLHPGPYLILPLLGASSVRDSVSLVPDWYSQPIAYLDDPSLRIGLTTVFTVDKRADLLGAGKLLDEAAFDPYTFTRDAFWQKRYHDIYDGNPPEADWDAISE